MSVTYRADSWKDGQDEIPLSSVFCSLAKNVYPSNPYLPERNGNEDTFFFSDKLNCHICDHILEDLENIDDECDVYGIHMVKIQDPQLAKRYSIKTFPALVYFRWEKSTSSPLHYDKSEHDYNWNIFILRNGNPLLFEGDLQNEESILEWLIDDDNRELADEIESVNDRMLERLLHESPLLVVFFCKYSDIFQLIQCMKKTDKYNY